MADDISASIHHLRQPKKAPVSAAERARQYRERQKAQAAANLPAVQAPPQTVTFVASHALPGDAPRPRRSVAPTMLRVAALGLGTVGVVINGWFARSLGSTEIAGYLFLAIGVGADTVALTMPSVAAGLWAVRQRATAGTAWAIWAMTITFALMSGLGFAALNVTDVTQTRSERSTPAIVTARTALSDAQTARDRECKGGVGKWCREREATVTERQQALDVAMASVAATADPQADAAVRLATWVSRGALAPTGSDFAMLRLLLLSLLPQIGGMLLMIARRS